MTPESTLATDNPVRRTPTAVLALGFAALTLEGYDLIMYGTVVPSLLAYEEWALTPEKVGFLGSLASRVEEASNASMPVTMTATACYLVSILLVSQEPSGILARVLTFFPPAAPMVVPLRAALDAITPIEIVLSIVVMLAAIWILFVVGARVYAGAVLQTGSRMKIRDAWRARA